MAKRPNSRLSGETRPAGGGTVRRNQTGGSGGEAVGDNQSGGGWAVRDNQAVRRVVRRQQSQM